MAQRLQTIRAQIRKLEKQAKALERGASKGIEAVARVIAKYGLSLSDLKQAMGVGGARRSRRSPLVGRSVPVKYRDSKGNTWSGRGRPPLWLVAAEKAGQKREAFLIGGRAAKSKAKAKSKRPSRKAASPAIAP